MEKDEVEKILSELIKNQVVLSNIMIQSIKSKQESDSLITNILMNSIQKNIEINREFQHQIKSLTKTMLVVISCLSASILVIVVRLALR